ncbi:MAG: hypothetical protein O9327_10540 [Polaromonas sp.]|nr:hypothetical protein [Polaromonas sp.]
MATFAAEDIRNEIEALRASMRAHAHRSNPLTADDAYFFDGEAWLSEHVGAVRADRLRRDGMGVLVALDYDSENHVASIRLPWAALVWLTNAARREVLANELTLPTMAPTDAWIDNASLSGSLTCTLTVNSLHGDLRVRLSVKVPVQNAVPMTLHSSPQSAWALLSCLADPHWADPSGAQRARHHCAVDASRSQQVGWIDPIEGHRIVHAQDRVGVPVFQSLIPQEFSFGFMGEHLLWQRSAKDWLEPHAHLRIPSVLVTSTLPQGQALRAEWLSLGMQRWTALSARRHHGEQEEAPPSMENRLVPSRRARSHRL